LLTLVSPRCCLLACGCCPPPTWIPALFSFFFFFLVSPPFELLDVAEYVFFFLRLGLKTESISLLSLVFSVTIPICYRFRFEHHFSFRSSFPDSYYLLLLAPSLLGFLFFTLEKCPSAQGTIHGPPVRTQRALVFTFSFKLHDRRICTSCVLCLRCNFSLV